MSETGAMEWRSRIRLVDEVVDVIRDRIYEGHYPPGTPLRQEQLAAELNVSRTPLREALRMLEREGLVTVSPGRGLSVISCDLPTLLAAYEVREVIDGLAARLVAQHGGQECADRLRGIVEEQRETLDPWEPQAYTTANVGFHRAIIEASQNEYVIAQLPLVRMTSQVFTPIKLVDQSRAATAIVEHEAIVEAVRAGNADEAERLARWHIRRTINSLTERQSGGSEAKGAE